MESGQRSKRRMSVDDATSSLLHHLQNTTNRLSKLWDEVNMEEEMREKRTEAAYNIFFATMNEIVASEEEMIAGVHADIKNHEANVQKMLKSLGMPPFHASDLPPNSIALMKVLKVKEQELKKQLEKAMAHQLEEYNKLVKICQNLAEPVPPFAGIEDEIVPPTVVEKIVKQRTKFEREFAERRAEIRKLQEQATRRHHFIPNVTLTSLELELMTTNFEDCVLLPKSLLVELRTLIEKFEVEYATWREGVEFQYAEKYTELSDLAEKCCANDIIGAYPEAFDVDVHDISLMNNLQADIDALKKRYDEDRKLFDSFHQWHLEFRQLAAIDVELKSDRARQNRGGYMNKLLTTQKTAKRNADDLLHKLRDLCHEKESEITVGGRSLFDHALWLIQEREHELENEKAMKKMAKDRLAQMEVRFGTSGAGSPSKSIAGTPRKRAITPMSAKSAKTPKLMGRPPLSATRN